MFWLAVRVAIFNPPIRIENDNVYVTASVWTYKNHHHHRMGNDCWRNSSFSWQYSILTVAPLYSHCTPYVLSLYPHCNLTVPSLYPFCTPLYLTLPSLYTHCILTVPHCTITTTTSSTTTTIITTTTTSTTTTTTSTTTTSTTSTITTTTTTTITTTSTTTTSTTTTTTTTTAATNTTTALDSHCFLFFMLSLFNTIGLTAVIFYFDSKTCLSYDWSVIFNHSSCLEKCLNDSFSDSWGILIRRNGMKTRTRCFINLY